MKTASLHLERARGIEVKVNKICRLYGVLLELLADDASILVEDVVPCTYPSLDALQDFDTS